MINNGYWFGGLDIPAGRGPIYARETHFSRTTRGTRTDIVATYDPTSLSFVSEIEIPPHRAAAVRMQGFGTLFGDDRYLAVTNFTPAQSITFLDMDQNRLLGEIATPGCMNPFAGQGTRVHILCGDGSFMTFEVGPGGTVSQVGYGTPQFDANADPVTLSGVRNGSDWVFVSLDGYIHEFSTDGGEMTLRDRWSILSDRQRANNWRISGLQHLAVHQASGRAYVLMHKGTSDTFEDPGNEVWVFDLASHERVRRIKLKDLAVGIAVSQDDAPLLYTRSVHIPLPALFTLWIYMTQGEDALQPLATYGVDVYDLGSGRRTQVFPDLGAPFATLYPW